MLVEAVVEVQIRLAALVVVEQVVALVLVV
jgi:hypothetical protein